MSSEANVSNLSEDGQKIDVAGVVYEPVAIKPMKQISESREPKLISSPNAAGEIEFGTADTQGRR